MRLPETWRSLAIVIATSTTVGFTLALTFPLLTIALERTGASPFFIGLHSAVGGIGIFVIGPFIETIVRKLGTVGCIRASFAVCAVCLLLFPLEVNAWIWLPIRLVYGCAAALMFVLSEAAVNSLTPEGQRGRILGIYATLFSLGYAGGPLVLLLAGTDGYRPFIVAALLFLLGIVPTFWLGQLEERLHPAPTSERGNLFLQAWRVAPLAMACVLAYAFLEGAHFALLPVWALSLGDSGSGAAGLVGIWLSGNILLQIPLGWLADRVERRLVVAMCCALATLVLLILPQVATTPRLLWPTLVLSGGFMGGLYTLALVLVGERFRGPDLTWANTIFVMNFQIGLVAGPIVVGSVMDLAGDRAFPLALLPAVAALAVFASRRRALAPRATTP